MRLPRLGSLETRLGGASPKTPAALVPARRLLGAERFRPFLQESPHGPFPVSALTALARGGQALDHRARLGPKLKAHDARIGDLPQRLARLVAKFKIDGKESHPSSFARTALPRQPSLERAELTPRAIGAEQNYFLLVLALVEVARQVCAPAHSQLVALGTAFHAPDDRPPLTHDLPVPAARAA
jgi:hypothetical protein